MSTGCQYLNSSIMKCLDHLFELFGSSHRSTTRTSITTHGRKKVDCRISPCIYLGNEEVGCHASDECEGHYASKRLSNFYHVVPWVREPLQLQLIKLKNRK